MRATPSACSNAHTIFSPSGPADALAKLLNERPEVEGVPVDAGHERSIGTCAVRR